MPGKLTHEELQQRLLDLPAIEGKGRGLQPDIIHALTEQLKQQPLNLEQDIMLKKLLPRLQQPALLIKPEQRQALQAAKPLTAKHEALNAISVLLIGLETLQQISENNDILQDVLQRLIRHYQNFTTQLCQTEVHSIERQALLEPPAQLIAEGLGVFILSQDLARKLLCRNRFGEQHKENESGNHAVVGYGGIHFKPNPEGKDYIAPGIEYATYCLYESLQIDCIAPTILLKIRNVLLKKVIPCPKNTDYPIYKQALTECYNTEKVLEIHPHLKLEFAITPYERAVQAGLTIEGILLYDLLSLLQVSDFLQKRLGEAFFSVLQELIDGTLVQHLLQEYPTLTQAKGEDLLEAYTSFMMRYERNHQITDFQDWIARPLTQRQKQFESLVLNPDASLQVYALIRAYPNLMAQQSLVSLLEIPRAVKLMQKLYPQAPVVELATGLFELWDKLDMDNFSVHIISSLLGNPTDGKADNAIVEILRDKQHKITQLRIIGIDNDKGFAPGISGKGNKHSVQIKQILYFFPQMRASITQAVRKQLLSQTPEQFVVNWLSRLYQQNQSYRTLIPFLTHGEPLKGRTINEVEDASDYALLETGNIPIGLEASFVPRFYQKLKQLKSLLLNNPDITHQALFQTLEPAIALFYQEIHYKHPYPLDALTSIYNGHYTFEGLLAAQLETAINEQQNLRTYLQTLQNNNEDYEEKRKQTIEETLALWVNQVDWGTEKIATVIPLINQIAQLPLKKLPLSVNNASKWLRSAVAQGLVPAVKLLLASGADVTQPDEVERTVMHLLMYNAVSLAHLRGDEQVITLAEMLLGCSKVPIDTWDEKGCTPLYYLVVSLQEMPALFQQLAKRLLFHGADIERENKESGETLLERSMRYEDILAFCLLINLGAGSKSDASVLHAFIDKHYTHPYHQGKLQIAQKQLAQQNSLFAWQLSLRRLTQAMPPTAKEIEEVRKDIHPEFNYEIEGALIGKRYLRPEVVRLLFNRDGIPRKNNLHGRRPVVYLEDNEVAVHVKFYPELPGVEEAVQVLSQQILGYSIMPSELFRFISPTGSIYPVLISQHVPGVKANAKHHGNVQELFNHHQNEPEKINAYFDKLDAKSFSELVLLTMLTNPEDGKPDNFVLQPYTNSQGLQSYRLVGIDNDHAFVEPILRNSKGQRELQVKTLVYCLSQMEQALHPAAVAAFLKLDPLNILRKWLKILIQRQIRYEQLFPFHERQSLLQRGKSWFSSKDECPVVIPIPFAPRSVVKIYEKFSHMQALLKKQPMMTGFALLRHVLPFLGLRYQAAFKAKLDSSLSATAPHSASSSIKASSTVLATPASRFQHVAFILYSSAIAGNYGISITGRQLLKSSAIPEEQLLQAQSPYSPIKAYDELELAQNESKKIDEVKHALLSGNFTPFQELLLDSSKEKILRAIDFGPLSEKLQKAILKEALANISFLDLSLKNCKVLTDSLLIHLLEASPSLRSLEIHNCPHITESFLYTLTDECQALEKLTLSDLPKLLQLKKIRSLRKTGTLVFPQLQQLKLLNLRALKSWKLQIRQLEKLVIINCPLITQSMVQALTYQLSLLAHLKVQQCPKLELKHLLKTVLCQHQQWTSHHVQSFMRDDTFDLKGLPINNRSLELITERRFPFKHIDLRGCNHITREGLLILMRHPEIESASLCDYMALPKQTALEGHSDYIKGLATLSDGRIVSGSGDSTLRLWNANTGKCIQVLTGHTKPIIALTLVNDRQMITRSQDTTTCLWDTELGKCTAVLSGHQDLLGTHAAHPTSILTMLPDKRLISGNFYNTSLTVTDIASMQTLAVLTGHTDTVAAIAVTQNKLIVSGSLDNTLRIWNSTTYQCIATLKGHTDGVTALASLEGGRIASGSKDKSVRLWDADTRQCISILMGHTDVVNAITALANGYIVSGSRDTTLRLWNADMGLCIATLQGNNQGVNDITIMTDGHIVSGCEDGILRVWQFPTLQLNSSALQKIKQQFTLTVNQEGLILSVPSSLYSFLEQAIKTLSYLLNQDKFSLNSATHTAIIPCTNIKQLYRWTKQLQGLQPMAMFLYALPSSISETDIKEWLAESWPIIELRLPAVAQIGQSGWRTLISSFPRLSKLDYSCIPSSITAKSRQVKHNALASFPNYNLVGCSSDSKLQILDDEIKQLNLNVLSYNLIITQQENDLTFTLMNHNQPVDSEISLVLNHYKEILYLCFGLADDKISINYTSGQLTVNCLDIAQSKGIKQFLSKCWEGRAYKTEELALKENSFFFQTRSDKEVVLLPKSSLKNPGFSSSKSAKEPEPVEVTSWARTRKTTPNTTRLISLGLNRQPSQSSEPAIKPAENQPSASLETEKWQSAGRTNRRGIILDRSFSLGKI